MKCIKTSEADDIRLGNVFQVRVLALKEYNVTEYYALLDFASRAAGSSCEEAAQLQLRHHESPGRLA